MATKKSNTKLYPVRLQLLLSTEQYKKLRALSDTKRTVHACDQCDTVLSGTDEFCNQHPNASLSSIVTGGDRSMGAVLRSLIDAEKGGTK